MDEGKSKTTEVKGVQGEESEEIKSPKRKVVRVESEATQDYAREAESTDQEEVEELSFQPSAISFPQKMIFRCDIKAAKKLSASGGRHHHSFFFDAFLKPLLQISAGSDYFTFTLFASFSDRQLEALLLYLPLQLFQNLFCRPHGLLVPSTHQSCHVIHEHPQFLWRMNFGNLTE